MDPYVNVEPGRGVYDTRRAAALSGVPASTLHYWARHDIYRPSIAPGPRTRLWSWRDLLAIRALHWYRREKGPDAPRPVSMPKIRRMLRVIQEAGESPQALYQLVAVSAGGDLYVTRGDDAAMRADDSGQMGWPEALNLVSPYLGGPDLLKPRPLLRIIPGKLHGEPHVRGTRIPSTLIYHLVEMGYDVDTILRLYPSLSTEEVDDAVDLERSLRPRAA